MSGSGNASDGPGLVVIILVFAASICSLSMGNALLKVGMDQVHQQQPDGIWATIGTALTTWQVPVGVVLMAMQFVGMLTLFEWNLAVSVVVPIFGLHYVVTALLGQLWIGENVTWVRWLGILLIVGGAVLVGDSGSFGQTDGGGGAQFQSLDGG